MRNSELLWRSAEDVYLGIVAHPFVRGLSDGSLRREIFVRFVEQDYLYLQRYRSALAMTAARARRAEDAELLASMAAEISSVELGLHEDVLNELGIRVEEMEPSPTTVAYTSYLSSTACLGSFEESIAAILPCSWIYLEVGRTLSRGPPSPDPLYRRWIDQYSGPEYQEEVRRLIDAVDSIAADDGTLEAMRRAYRTSAIYEYMFWDDAYTGGRFPYPVRPPDMA